MDDDYEWGRKQSYPTFNVLSLNLPRGAEINHEQHARIVGLWPENPTRDLPKTKHEANTLPQISCITDNDE